MDEQVSTPVAQATGRVSVQAECTIADALQMMRDRATIEHTSLEDVATRVIDRRIWFGPPT